MQKTSCHRLIPRGPKLRRWRKCRSGAPEFIRTFSFDESVEGCVEGCSEGCHFGCVEGCFEECNESSEPSDKGGERAGDEFEFFGCFFSIYFLFRFLEWLELNARSSFVLGDFFEDYFR